jgi:heme-degrading monooxygenase HmoA
MIVRLWRGEATAENADAYVRHLTGTVFPSLRGLPGHRGAHLLRRKTAAGVEFLAVTEWDSAEAIEAFAGKDIETAIVEPEARAILSSFDTFARHYERVDQRP